jgi:hypothetical protein
MKSFAEEYEALPESIKDTYSLKEYRCLTDADRASLIERETEPEWEEL